MLTEYIAKKLNVAKYKLLADGSYFGEIAGCPGVWADAKTLEACRAELREVLEDWVVLKLRSGENVPGLMSKIDKRALVKHA